MASDLGKCSSWCSVPSQALPAALEKGVISEVLPESQRPEFKYVLNSIFCMIAFSAHIGENCGII
jgi:hypothetical protein